MVKNGQAISAEVSVVAHFGELILTSTTSSLLLLLRGYVYLLPFTKTTVSNSQPTKNNSEQNKTTRRATQFKLGILLISFFVT